MRTETELNSKNRIIKGKEYSLIPIKYLLNLLMLNQNYWIIELSLCGNVKKIKQINENY